MRQVFFLPDGTGGYVVEVPSLPGCRAEGKKLSEAIHNIIRAIYEYIEKQQALGLPVPESSVIAGPNIPGVIADNILLREDVIHVAQEVFPNQNLGTLMAEMDAYGKESYENDRERVQIAIIRLSEGNLDQLLKLVAEAKRDYRDVIMGYATKFGRYP